MKFESAYGGQAVNQRPRLPAPHFSLLKFSASVTRDSCLVKHLHSSFPWLLLLGIALRGVALTQLPRVCN
jgi:hypothetical protein